MSANRKAAWSPGAASPALRAVDWRDRAACGTDPDLFFGPDGETAAERRRRERKAKALCVACPVRAECQSLFRAVGSQYGVWAGLGEGDRGRSYAGFRPHKSSGDRARLEAIHEAGERPCSGPCQQVKPLTEFPSHGGMCRPCLSDRMREMNRRRREAQEAA